MATKYKAAEQFYNAAKAEYDYELNRNANLDNKVSMTLAFCGVVLLFLINYLDISSIWETEVPLICSQCVIRFVSSLLQIACLFSFGVCIVKLFRMLRPKVYCRLDPDYLLSEGLPEWTQLQANLYIGKKYSEFTAFNRNVNETRSKEYNNSIRWLLLSILFCVANEALKFNFI